ncbi:MAG: phytanoyl-CoA dioxygenase family protein [Prochloron sp. SP5CPC1]|nr:phytanoyl-CoA dioxygenase family protein [Candidatus Paraprochloron terpiosi SP5CPC1]
MKEVRAAYQDNGFYISKQPVIPLNIVQAALKSMEAVRQGHYDTGISPADPSWTAEEGNDVLCRISMPYFASQAVRDLIEHPALAKFVAEVTGSEVLQAWWNVYFSQPPTMQSETYIGVHQDFAYWTELWDNSDGLFTAWIALNDVRQNSGALHYAAQTNKNRGEHNFFFEGDLNNQIQIVRQAHKGEWREELALLPAGGISIHHGLTYHWSGLNTSSQPIINIAIHLRSEKSKLLKKERKTRYIDQFDKCPVIYGAASLIQDFG